MTETLDLWMESLPVLLGGLAVSVRVTALCLALGIPFGLLLALARRARSAWVRFAAAFIVEGGRGAPVLIILQFAYFGLPNVGLSLSSFGAAAAALAWSTGAYTSEIMRAGIQAVPQGQREAAEAVGLTTVDSLRYIILPQSLRVSVPALLGFAIATLQTTSLCFTIALPELTSQAYVIGSNTFQYMPIMVLTAALYAAICVPATISVAMVERRMSRHEA